MAAPLALRIDVDFPVGLRRAVPFFLDTLRRGEMRATFFVVSGSNRPVSSLRRIVRPGYLPRLRRLGLSGVWRSFGRSLCGRGVFLQRPEDREMLRRIVDEGHELAVHGHDHAWWADHVWSASAGRVREEIDRAFARMEQATGMSGLAWASPSWRSNETVLEHLRSKGVRYFSDCWGHGPFLTVDGDGATIPVPHLPVTLPSLESLVLQRGLAARAAARAVVDARVPGSVGVACLHDYFEGLLRPELLRELVDAFGRAGVRTIPLNEAAAEVERGAVRLPLHRLTRGPLPGFSGDFSWQDPQPTAPN